MIGALLPSADSPVGIGLFLDPSTGQVMVSQGLGVAIGAAVWLVGVALGLIISWLVLP